MPPPPPPPQPASGPPRLKNSSTAKGGSAPVDRNALLSSIQKGAKLKKTVTNDRSGPLVDGKLSNARANGSVQGFKRTEAVGNGGPPQLGGLFAGGMIKLRPTGRTEFGGSTNSLATSARTDDHSISSGLGKKSSAPPTPPSGSKPLYSSQPQLSQLHGSTSSLSSGSVGAPPSPKPSVKSNPAPPPPPASRKPTMQESGAPPPPPASKPPSMRSSESHSEISDRNPPLPVKPPTKTRLETSQRGPPPPRPPSSSKPNFFNSSSELSINGDLKKMGIDRSISMREPQRAPTTQARVGTSAESPAAPFRVNANHRVAPPVPASHRPVSKTVGRSAGMRIAPVLRHPSDKPPKPPTRPAVAAPPPPSQPPPPPPPHRLGAEASKANVPLPPLPLSPVPPLPPERHESTRSSAFASSNSLGELESRFSSNFKSHHQFPLPLTYKNIPKTYPSKNNVKHQRRAPQPPTSSSAQSIRRDPAASRGTSSSASHPHPPPQPPHAPIHLQMNRKFYGAEASQC